jgi:hypothetical protein
MMTKQIEAQRFASEVYDLLDETFEHVHGIYLDGGTSLFETLETVSAEEASRPVSARCASIAGQVEHVRFYLEILEKYMRGEEVGKVDWQGSWYLKSVRAGEWEALKGRLRDRYASVLALVKSFEAWDGENDIGGALAIIVHTAYHLGEIRQAMCSVKNQFA